MQGRALTAAFSGGIAPGGQAIPPTWGREARGKELPRPPFLKNENASSIPRQKVYNGQGYIT